MKGFEIMPRKKKTVSSYRLDTDKKIIYRYDNIPATKQDEADILLYVSVGYIIKHTTKTSVDDMREALKTDPKALEEFNKLYNLKTNINDKGKEELGFHSAVKFYNTWKKEHEQQDNDE